MMKIWFFCTALVLLGCPIAAQQAIVGKVVDGNTGNAIAGASIFISNTTYGTSSSTDGTFRIARVPWGTYDIVVSSMGYESYAAEFTHLENEATHLQITMVVKPTVLDEVAVIAFEKDGWGRWGKLFLEAFVGTSPNAAQTKLLNHDVIRFRHHKDEGYLEVIALEPLRIENRSLGYSMVYILSECRIDFRNRTNMLSGYPRFQEVDASRRRNRRFEKRRKATYDSSVMRFMRSLHRGSLTEDGYEVRRMERKPNVEKMRTAAIRRSLYQTTWDSVYRVNVSKLVLSEPYTADSLAYFESLAKEPDEIVTVFPQLLTADDLVSEGIGGRKLLAFDDFLHIQNTSLREHRDYLEYQREMRNPGIQTAMLSLLEGAAVQVESNGSYFPPEVMFRGWYWSWCNKLADLLPLDYEPPSGR